jgi:hypothetical protein
MRAVSSFSIGDDIECPIVTVKIMIYICVIVRSKKEISFFAFQVSPAWANSLSLK